MKWEPHNDARCTVWRALGHEKLKQQIKGLCPRVQSRNRFWVSFTSVIDFWTSLSEGKRLFQYICCINTKPPYKHYEVDITIVSLLLLFPYQTKRCYSSLWNIFIGFSCSIHKKITAEARQCSMGWSSNPSSHNQALLICSLSHGSTPVVRFHWFVCRSAWLWLVLWLNSVFF